MQLAVSYHQSGQLSSAVEHYQRSLLLLPPLQPNQTVSDPENVDPITEERLSVLVSLSEALRDLGQAGAAADCLGAVLRIDPGDTAARVEFERLSHASLVVTGPPRQSLFIDPFSGTHVGPMAGAPLAHGNLMAGAPMPPVPMPMLNDSRTSLYSFQPPTMMPPPLGTLPPNDPRMSIMQPSYVSAFAPAPAATPYNTPYSTAYFLNQQHEMHQPSKGNQNMAQRSGDSGPKHTFEQPPMPYSEHRPQSPVVPELNFQQPQPFFHPGLQPGPGSPAPGMPMAPPPASYSQYPEPFPHLQQLPPPPPPPLESPNVQKAESSDDDSQAKRTAKGFGHLGQAIARWEKENPALNFADFAMTFDGAKRGNLSQEELFKMVYRMREAASKITDKDLAAMWLHLPKYQDPELTHGVVKVSIDELLTIMASFEVSKALADDQRHGSIHGGSGKRRMSSFGVGLSNQYFEHTGEGLLDHQHRQHEHERQRQHRHSTSSSRHRGDGPRRSSTVPRKHAGRTATNTDRPLFPAERARENRNSMIRQKLRKGRELLRSKEEAELHAQREAEVEMQRRERRREEKRLEATMTKEELAWKRKEERLRKDYETAQREEAMRRQTITEQRAAMEARRRAEDDAQRRAQRHDDLESRRSRLSAEGHQGTRRL